MSPRSLGPEEGFQPFHDESNSYRPRRGNYRSGTSQSPPLEEREELTRWSKSRTLTAGEVFKSTLILALADGKSYSTVEAELNTSRPTISRWKAGL